MLIKNIYSKNKIKKGNIILTLLISLLVITTIFTLYISYARDKRSSNISIERMQNKVKLNAYNIIAQTALYKYFSNYEIPITYTQLISGEEDNILIHRVSVTNPYLINLEDVEVESIGGIANEEGKMSYIILKESEENIEIKGFNEIEGNDEAKKDRAINKYKYDIKIMLNLPKVKQGEKLQVEDFKDELRIDNFFKNNETNFWEDNSLKGNSSYSVELKDIPIYIILRYGVWEQRINCVLRGATFLRELFPIIINPETGYPVGLNGAIDVGYVNTVRGFVNLDNAEFVVIESFRNLNK